MEPDVINRRGNVLFPINVGSVAADYLAFLAERVPQDVAEQLYRDGQPDIGMPAQTVDVTDLVRPLSSGTFPAEKLAHITGLLGYIVTSHEIGFDENRSGDDPYKMIYAASLYLYCFISGGGVPTASGYLAAIRIMATVSLKLDLQSRLQVCRFLASLVPMLPSGSTDERAPLSSLLLTLSVIVGSIVSDLGMFAEHTMKNEHIGQEWRKEQEAEEAGEPACHRIVVLKQLLLEMFGASGKVRESADRFLLAIAEGEGQEKGPSLISPQREV